MSLEYIAGACLGGLLMTLSVLLYRYLDAQQHRRFKDRFAGRERVPYHQQVLNRSGGSPNPDASVGWLRVSQVLRIDPDLLRPEDRFDDILSEDRSFPSDGDFHDLCDLIEHAINAAGECKKIETLWDAANVIGNNENRKIKRDGKGKDRGRLARS